MYPNRAQQQKLVAKLLGALVLAIFLFACAYYALSTSSADGLKTPNGSVSFLDCIYFSVVTVSTLGYGDLTPMGWSRTVASLEAIFGLTFVGFAISQVVSAKQEALVEYLANDRIIQTYDSCLAMITDAKELIGDRRRLIQARVPVDPIDYLYNRSNPFYPALRAIEMLNGYTAHIVEIGKAKPLSVRVERAAHHVEELAGFTRKLVNLLEAHKAPWRTPRTQTILRSLCDAIDTFVGDYVVHTRYATEEYKGGGFYRDVVRRLTSDIRARV